MTAQPFTTNPSVLRALADRCEREEPSDKLDAAIARAVLGPNRYVLPYTTSLDAAVTLVPEGWCIDSLGDEGTYGDAQRFEITGCSVRLSDGFSESSFGEASSRAAAICAASLRALALLAEGEA